MKVLRDKQVVLLLLITGVLVVGAVITSILVAQHAVTTKNRAAENIQCKPSLIRCTPTLGATTTSYKVKLLDESGTPFPNEKVSYSGTNGDLTYIPTDVNEPIDQYSCQVVGFDQNGAEDPTCTRKATATTVCARFNTTETPPVTPVGGGGGGGGMCACTPGDIDCQTKKVEQFPGPEGPGYVEINPIFKGPACFTCKEIVIKKDGQDFKILDCQQKSDGTLLDKPIALNQASGQQCATYTFELKGTDPDAKPMSCANCSSKVCCPACTPPVEVPNTNGKRGCSAQCDIKFADACHQVGKPGSVIIQSDGVHCISIPGAWVQCKEYKKEDTVPIPAFQNGGSSEVSIGCLVDPDSRSIENSDYLCTYRFPITCTQPSDAPPVVTPSGPVATVTPPPPTPTVKMCIPLRPRLRVDCSDPQDPNLCQ